jgi:hypothetical protein
VVARKKRKNSALVAAIPPNKKRRCLETKGQRKMPVACDKYGCKHSGITELKELSRTYLKAYVKKDGWLYKTPCKDCASRPESEAENKVMEMATVLDKREEPNDDMARYCNFGPVAHSMKQGEEFKKGFACSMILCKGCFRKRLEMNDGNEGETSRRRSRRRKTP